MPLLVDKNTIKLYKKLKALGGAWDNEAKGWQMPEAAMTEAQALLVALPPPKPEVPRVLREAREAVNAGRTVQAALQRALWRVQADLVASDPPDGGVDVDHLTFGYHECLTSPTLSCVYDTHEDPRMADCLFCHKPGDRE